MKILSLFSGCGGLDLGFKQAGFEIPVANEYDKSIFETFEKNFPKTNLIKKSIAKLEIKELPKNIAGEWFFVAENTGAGNGAKLTFFDEVLSEAVTIEFDGTENGARDDTAAMVAGSIVVTIA